MQRGVELLRAKTSIPVGAYAIVHDAGSVAAFAEAWRQGALPGEPRFRLSARGASLDEMAQCTGALPQGPARSALLAVLPRCVCEQQGLTIGDGDEPAGGGGRETAHQRIHSGRSLPYHPCGSDPVGAFEACREGTDSCAGAGCPGTAVGWHSTARSQRWSGKSN
jgi:hypothetical protein